MVELNETTIGMVLGILGVVSTVVWYAFTWYGIRALQDIRDALRERSNRPG